MVGKKLFAEFTLDLTQGLTMRDNLRQRRMLRQGCQSLLLIRPLISLAQTFIQYLPAKNTGSGRQCVCIFVDQHISCSLLIDGNNISTGCMLIQQGGVTACKWIILGLFTKDAQPSQSFTGQDVSVFLQQCQCGHTGPVVNEWIQGMDRSR